MTKIRLSGGAKIRVRTFVAPAILAALLGLALTAALAWAQVNVTAGGVIALLPPSEHSVPRAPDGGFDPLWASADGGGGMFSTGGNFSLGGTAGQPDAGRLQGGVFSLDGGFWSASLSASTSTPTPIAKLVGHVTWQGVPQTDPRSVLPITLTLKLGGTEVNYPQQTTDATGFFTVAVTGLPNGTYNWRAHGPDGAVGGNVTPGFLSNCGTVALAGGTQTNMENGILRGGDANNDNVVSISDFNILKNTFGRSLGDPGYDARGDFNIDNVVSVTDFNLLKGTFGASGCPST